MKINFKCKIHNLDLVVYGEYADQTFTLNNVMAGEIDVNKLLSITVVDKIEQIGIRIGELNE